MYVAGGTFSARRPARVDSVVDLAGGFVVPPFGDAHAHHFESLPMAQRLGPMYLRDGIFYGMSLTNWMDRAAVMPYWARTETMDIAWADAGITGPHGHPILIYESLARGRYDFNADSLRPWTDRRAEGKAYFIIRSEAELDEAWPRIVSGRPDVIKTYLVHSERHAENSRDTSRLGHVGLDPALLPFVVRRAHADGLRVAAHVESAADFRTALDAGVDMLAHLPGYHLPAGGDPAIRRLTDADAQRAARAGLVVIAGPLRGIVGYTSTDTAAVRAARELQIHNLSTLRRAGVRVALGSDTYGQDAAPEAAYTAGLSVFTPAEMLRMWSETTPRLIFPTRRIGRLEGGYEASLLVLGCDPLARWECTADVRLRIKQGQRIDVPPPPAGN
jgi:predicted amidohydrolase YtcJ